MQHDRLSDLRFEQQLGGLTSDEQRELAGLEARRSTWEADRRARLRFAACGEIIEGRS